MSITTAFFPEDAKHINKLCYEFSNFEVSQEKILAQLEEIVSSTNNTPIKDPPNPVGKLSYTTSTIKVVLMKKID